MYKQTKKLQSTIATSQVFERTMVHILLGFVFIAFALYLYAMLSTVSLALARRSTEVAIRDVSSETASLEETYLALSQNLTLASQPDLGLVLPKTVAYARGGSGAAVAFASHGF